ncbi:MAG TPA: hypothetical protein DCZ95_17055 [Verrucomicrobia bacterium]|nr:MAG: hypothetical protein A2X46_09540 [Lentisphaerae bacterium GWF2_57_35]HBA85794.1 hypothetical protein [Verrucomicrobiota bacterium]
MLPMLLLAGGPDASSECQDAFQPVRFLGAWTPFFESNTGRFPADVKYFSRGIDYAVGLKSDGLDLLLVNLEAKTNEPYSSCIGIRFVGASPYPTIEGAGRFPQPMRYYLGTMPPKLQEVTAYSKVQYKSVFPGVDLFFSCNSTFLEYYFVLSGRANLYDVVMEFSGADKMSLNEDGELVIRTKAGTIIRPAPKLYQEVNGIREPIAGGYVLLTKNRVGFDAGPYNQMASLVIDPVLVYFKTENNWAKNNESDKAPRLMVAPPR